MVLTKKFAGNKSHLLVTFSLEVNDGVISTSLPAHLVETAELKSMRSNQWQPLQTFVTISRHFLLTGKGIRFQGTIGDCNNAMQQLFYHVSLISFCWWMNQILLISFPFFLLWEKYHGIEFPFPL